MKYDYDFPERIRYFRMKRNLNAVQLSKLLKMNPNYITGIEFRHQNLFCETLLNILDVLDLTMKEFLEEDIKK